MSSSEVRKVAVISKYWPKTNANVITHYVLRDIYGNEWVIGADLLKEQIRNGEVSVVNLSVASDGRLMPTSPKKTYRLPEDLQELNIFNFGNILLRNTKYRKVQMVTRGEGIITDLRLSVRVGCNTNIKIYCPKVLCMSDNNNDWRRVRFQYDIFNNIFGNLIHNEYQAYEAKHFLAKINSEISWNKSEHYRI